MALFSTIKRHGAQAAPVDASNLLPWYAFDGAIERSLTMLRGMHIPVSLFAAYLGDENRHEAAEVVGEALSRFGSVGRLPDGGIGLLYLGPRAPNEHGDAALTSHLYSRIERRLQECGWTALARRMEFTAAHSWTDQTSGAADLVGRLARRPARRTKPEKH